MLCVVCCLLLLMHYVAYCMSLFVVRCALIGLCWSLSVVCNCDCVMSVVPCCSCLSLIVVDCCVLFVVAECHAW